MFNQLFDHDLRIFHTEIHREQTSYNEALGRYNPQVVAQTRVFVVVNRFNAVLLK